MWEKGKLPLFLESSQEKTNRTESEQSLGFTFAGVKVTWISSSGPVAGLRCRQGTGHPAETWPGELMTLYYFLLLVESCPTYSSQELIKEEHFCEAKWVSSTDLGCMAVGRAENLSAQCQDKPRPATNKDQIYPGILFSCTK